MKFCLYNSDCFDAFEAIKSNSVDLILCDLPYGTTQNKWDSVLPLEKLWEQYVRICKENAAIVLTASQPFTTKLIASNYNLFKYEWIWQKTRPVGHLNAKKRPMLAHESVLVFCKGTPVYYPQDLKPHGKINKRSSSGDNYNDAGTENFAEFTNYPRSVIEFSHDKEKIHPTQKPVALFEYLIKTYTTEGETVLDNTFGSGTTGVACANTGRLFLGMEQNADYFEKAQTRIKQAYAESSFDFSSSDVTKVLAKIV